MRLEVIVLAAGVGSRMRSSLPKVLHPLGGRPLLAHVLDCVQQLAPAAVHVVYGHGGDAVPKAFPRNGLNWVQQKEQLGTGHAVQQAMRQVRRGATVLVVYGDVPLVRASTLRPLVLSGADRLALLTAELSDPHGYGRILRDGNQVAGIVEEKDATAGQRAIKEVNTGFLAAPADKLGVWLDRIGNDNAQGEYYLTDVVSLAVADGDEVVAHHVEDEREIRGVNSQAELAILERAYQVRCATRFMDDGVAICDPSRFDARGEVSFGDDCSVDINVVLEGPVRIGNKVSIAPNVVIRRSRIADNVTIHPNCVIEDADIGPDCLIGPFSRIRPGSEIAAAAHIGNFVEIKNSRIGIGSKINHLAYVGDSTLGTRVNIGAGAITCNYDGANKYRTDIEDDVFVGSNTQLVAPVTIGKGATIGAGSTITNDVPPGDLAVARAKQRNLPGWQRPKKVKSEK